MTPGRSGWWSGVCGEDRDEDEQHAEAEGQCGDAIRPVAEALVDGRGRAARAGCERAGAAVRVARHGHGATAGGRALEAVVELWAIEHLECLERGDPLSALLRRRRCDGRPAP